MQRLTPSLSIMHTVILWRLLLSLRMFVVPMSAVRALLSPTGVSRSELGLFLCSSLQCSVTTSVGIGAASVIVVSFRLSLCLSHLCYPKPLRSEADLLVQLKRLVFVTYLTHSGLLFYH